MLGKVGKLYGKVGKVLKIRKLLHIPHSYTCTEAQEMTPVRAWVRTSQVPALSHPIASANPGIRMKNPNDKIVCMVVPKWISRPDSAKGIRKRRLQGLNESDLNADTQDVKSGDCWND